MTVNRVSSTRMNLKSLLLWAQGNPMLATQDLLSQVFCVVVLLCILCVSVCAAIENEPCKSSRKIFFNIIHYSYSHTFNSLINQCYWEIV